MRRASLIPFLVYAAVAVTAATAPAASLPSGTIACSLQPNDVYGLRFVPYISSTPGGRIIVKATLVGTCDGSSVNGGKGPIDHVEGKLLAKLEPGATCTDFVTAPDFGAVKLTLKWKGALGDRSRTIATSKTHLVQGSWDDPNQSLVFTADIFKGAFAGSATTVRVTIDPGSVGSLQPNCPPIEAIYYGADGESEITVP